MGELFGAGLDLPYAERIARLQKRGIGIWDVFKQCERPGSLDSRIVRASEVPNDIVGLLDEYITIHTLAFNGAQAYQAFKRHIFPRLTVDMRTRLTYLPLPSTSPANASMALAVKKAHWRKLLIK